ncbi:MAG: hypothetical protein HY395_02600 [Candidatus Doudnabacteria bacterium]|nr:hypothetical protein [Candidatus Doudnabacteria bacterium]
MTRETIEGMIRTALVTHHAKHGVMLPNVDEFIDRLATAIEAQQQREAQEVAVDPAAWDRAIRAAASADETPAPPSRRTLQYNDPDQDE